MNGFKRLRRPPTELAEEQALSWVAKLTGGTLSATQRAEFAVWLSLDASHPQRFDALVELWELTGQLTPAALARINATTESSSKDPSAGPAPKPTATRSRPLLTPMASLVERFGPIAASALLAVALIWGALSFRPDDRVLATDTGGYAKVALEDGSTLHLNTNTQVRVIYTEQARQLQLLKGEIFIEVAKDVSRPLTVATETFTAQAIGTAFSVARTPGLEAVEVAHGEVLVSNNPSASYRARGVGDQPMQQSLLAGEKLSLGASPTGLGALEPVAAQVASWRDGQLFYQDVALAELVADLNRYHAKQLVIQDSELRGLKLSAVLNSSDRQAAIDALCLSLDLTRVEISDSVTLLARSTAP